MQGKISSIKKHSLAEAAGIHPGETLLAANGKKLRDILDLSFLAADNSVRLELSSEDGIKREVTIDKEPDEDLGLIFESAVFDGIRCCANDCIFCFVQQMIPGLRPGLYVKDDDYRLSFLYGNFVTLTNMAEADFQRILTTHMSPLYVSVHTTDAKLRSSMMRNEQAGGIMERLQKLLDAGIEVHTQVVCCPGYNDGTALAKTYRDLRSLYPGVQTMAVVPVGLTKNRTQLTRLRAFSREEAAQLVDQVTSWQAACRKESGTSFIYLGDEFYLLAEKEMPPEDWYDGFPQLENGIGLSRNFISEWNRCAQHQAYAGGEEHYVIPVGESAYKIINPLLQSFNDRFHTHHEFLAVHNDFFGPLVNVTGLLTGGDILKALPGDKDVILPQMTLNTDNLFLDDMPLSAFEKRCGRRVRLAETAADLYGLLTGI
jgi:putative radical SAM enzyme (TIGR03279 family)